MMRSSRALVSAVALGALLASCGGGEAGPAETVPPGAFVIKAVNGLKFDAENYGPIPSGEVTLGLVNDDSLRHTLIIAEGDSKIPNFKLEVNKKGDVDSGAVTLDPGTYTLICDVPGHGNMRATLTVE